MKPKGRGRKLPVVTEARGCGACTTCCTTLGVAELRKPAYTKCAHETAQAGCAIYAERPPSCRRFTCLWLADPNGVLTREDEKPDTLGLVLYKTSNRLKFTLVTGEAILVAMEAWPGAFEEPRPKALLDRLVTEHLVCLILEGDHRRMLGPDPLLLKFRAYLSWAGDPFMTPLNP